VSEKSSISDKGKPTSLTPARSSKSAKNLEYVGVGVITTSPFSKSAKPNASIQTVTPFKILNENDNL